MPNRRTTRASSLLGNRRSAAHTNGPAPQGWPQSAYGGGPRVPPSSTRRARADAALIKGLMRRTARTSEMLWPLKPNLMGSARLRTTSGSCRYVRHFPGLGNGRFIEHAGNRCPYRRCRRSNCACSGLFALGAKSKELTLFNYASLPRRVEVEARTEASLVAGPCRNERSHASTALLFC
jgi:hypothetical protein